MGTPAVDDRPRQAPARHVFAVAILCVVAFSLFLPVLSHEKTWGVVAGHETVVWPWRGDVPPGAFNDTFPQSDEADSYFPWAVLEQRALDAGELPLWNPYSFAGSAFFTNGQNAALYPPRTLLAFGLDASWQHDLYLLLHVFASGLAMYALLCSLRLRTLVALFGAVAWQLTPFSMSWLQLEFMGVVATFLPLALMLARRAALARSAGSAAMCGVCLALLAMTNLPYGSVTAVIVIAYIIALCGRDLATMIRSGDRGGVARIAARIAVVPAVALGLSACVLIPTWLAVTGAGRVAFAPEVQHANALGWAALLDVVRPPDGGDVMARVYVGTVVGICALIGLVSRRPGSGLGRSCTLAFGALVFGGLGIAVARIVLPGFQYTHSPTRLIIFFAFGAVLLSAIGLATLVDLIETHVRFGRTLATALAAGAAAITGWQLADNARDVNPQPQPRADRYLFGDTPTLSAVRDEARRLGGDERLRIVPIRTGAPTMYASHSIVPAIESAAGYESLVDTHTVDLWRVVTGEPVASVLETRPAPGYFLTNFFAGETRYDLLPRVGVTTLLAAPDLESDPGWVGARGQVRATRRFAGPGGIVLDLIEPSPRAFVVGEHEVVSEPDALARYANPAFRYRERVLLNEDPGVPSGRAQGAVTSIRASLDEVWLDVHASAPAWLVLLDTYDRGWQATVDGRSAAVERANYNFRAVRVPAGNSRVHMIYRPPGLYAGIAVSAVTLLVLIGWGVRHRLRRRPAEGPGSSESRSTAQGIRKNIDDVPASGIIAIQAEGHRARSRAMTTTQSHTGGASVPSISESIE